MDTVPAKTILTRNKDTSWFGSDYNMNLYRGCSHGCIYCDSRSTCYHVEDFDRVCVKENALVLLRDELRRKVRTGVIGSGAMCDSYNPFERTELVTRHALELMDAFGFGASMLTKSPLILRDTDLYQEISTHSPVLCMMTITTADDGLSKKIEPGVPASSERFAAVRAMADQGLYTGVVMTPLLPFLEDTEQNIREMVKRTADTGARFSRLWEPLFLRQPPGPETLGDVHRGMPEGGTPLGHEGYHPRLQKEIRLHPAGVPVLKRDRAAPSFTQRSCRTPPSAPAQSGLESSWWWPNRWPGSAGSRDSP